VFFKVRVPAQNLDCVKFTEGKNELSNTVFFLPLLLLLTRLCLHPKRKKKKEKKRVEPA